LRAAGTDARDVTLTSGGTEANNIALRSLRLLPATSGGAPQLIVSRIEHSSVVRTALAMADEGLDVVWLEPGEDGRIDPAALERALTSRSASQRLVSVQAVNHETGVLQPLIEVQALCRAHGPTFTVTQCRPSAACRKRPIAAPTTSPPAKLRGPRIARSQLCADRSPRCSVAASKSAACGRAPKTRWLQRASVPRWDALERQRATPPWLVT
jgi:hypothetical protein